MMIVLIGTPPSHAPGFAIESSSRRQPVRCGTDDRFATPHLTNMRSHGMIFLPAAASTGRAQSAPATSRAQNTNPLRLPESEPSERTVKAAAPRRAPGRRTNRRRPRDARASKEHRTRHDVSNHLRQRGGPIGGDAPPATPESLRESPLLQHERLHLLPRRGRQHRRRVVSHLRLHPPPPLRLSRLGAPSLRCALCASLTDV
jgi:hypothetical protein